MTNDKGAGGFKTFSDLEKLTEKQRMETRGWGPEAEEELRRLLSKRI
jgi:hypothetical protein